LKAIITTDRKHQNCFTSLRDNDLYLKPSKCEFHKTKIEYLGLVIEEGKISMDTTKLKGIRDWPIPVTISSSTPTISFLLFILQISLEQHAVTISSYTRTISFLLFISQIS